MKLIITLLLANVLVAYAFTDKEEWLNFKSTNKKVYRTALEETKRFSIFQSNLRRIEAHNAKEEQGLSSYRMGVTVFADLTPQEFKDMMKLSKSERTEDKEITPTKLDYEGELPNEIDWRKKGAVTEIKNQLACGSCWSFSTTGTVEGANYRKTGKLVSLSEQNLVDCDKQDDGCGGGLMINALEYIEKNGIMSEKDYPYEAIDDMCKFNKSDVAVKITSFTRVAIGDEQDLQEKVALIGPVSIGIDATYNFQLYSSGVFDDDSCESDRQSLDHGVLAVGYGSKKGKDYWIVKNSWGTDWGMDGYILMSRNNKNQCGVATYAVVATM
ncbi:unnamed protein product [Phyllotreta striolata]|uniref:Uncharacterized protein n=1 Tax=Phyllotreta striolata TaxID=444603 RepID=A0A9N9XQW9_PHYSR|nr:unnamed protein product [Phyllotreta striolata]